MGDMFSGLEELGFSNLPKVELFKDEKTEALKKKDEKPVNPADYIYKKKYSCPNCEKDFENFAVRPSKIRHGKSDTDLRNYFEPFDPLYYDVILCPFCGYAALTTYFASLREKQSELIRENISKKFNTREYPIVYTPKIAIERHKLALYNAIVKEAKNSEKANICLKLTWLMRDAGDAAGELEFQKHALDGFCKAYESEEFPICGMDPLTLAYLIGELSRRAGDLNRALKWLGRVITARNVNTRLKNRAVEVKELINTERKT